MSRTLVDTNVLLDILKDDDWAEWSLAAVRSARSNGEIVIVDIIYAELSAGFANPQELDLFLEGIEVSMLSRDALFLAGKTFQAYRRRGGTRTGVLPDFFIGAHAQVESLPLLTRDRRRYETYFPGIDLIAP